LQPLAFQMARARSAICSRVGWQSVALTGEADDGFAGAVATGADFCAVLGAWNIAPDLTGFSLPRPSVCDLVICQYLPLLSAGRHSDGTLCAAALPASDA
jgi:hypothetical protein